MSVVQLMTPEYKEFVQHFPGVIDRSIPEFPTVAAGAIPDSVPDSDSKPAAKPKASKKKAEPKSGEGGRPNISAAKKGRK